MSSVQSFRDFICERLTAAAVEIFTAFEQTVAQYESEIGRQRKLLDHNWTPQIEVHISDTQKNACEDVEVLSEEGLSRNDRSTSVNQDEPEFSYIKEEPGDQSSDQEEQQHSLKLVTAEKASIRSSSTEKHSNDSDQESDTDPANHNQNQTDGNHMDSTSSKYTAMRSNRRRRNATYIAPISGSQCDITSRKKTKRRNVNGKACVGNPRRKRTGRVHTAEKPCCCETCGKSFRDNYTLSVHMRTHTGEKPYVCNTCGKCYRNRHGLVNHMRSHTGEKPYVCKTCGKSYKHSSGLSYHMKNHSSEAMHSCKTCGENFRESRDLSLHMSTHTGRNLYSCNDCGKSFRLSRDLLAHMRTHTGEKPYPCQQCGKSFRLRHYLIVHMRTHR